MGPKDLFITPLYLIIFFLLAYFIRPMVTDRFTRRYFIPALTLKFIGAIAVGFVYYYYYKGGDTVAYFDHGSKYIWEAFSNSPVKGFQLIFANGIHQADTYQYSSKIWYFRDLPSYFVIRVAGFFDLFTFHTYTATALLFSIFSFGGQWAMYSSFYKLFPHLHKQIAIAIFFVPSVFFWGSGILKDTLTLGALGWATYAFINLFFNHRKFILSFIIFLVASYIVYSIKIYILLCFLPAAIIWVFIAHIKKIKSYAVRIVIAPVVSGLVMVLIYYALLKVSEDSPRYSLDKLTYTAESSARWLAYVSEVDGGSGYTLGDFDYSAGGLARKAMPAIWVSLFRPYLWEVKNPIMLLAALESLGLLTFFLIIIFKSGIFNSIKSLVSNPAVIFCFAFTLAFAFAIGITTYNFGSLMRYKIPFIPFFLIGLYILKDIIERNRKLVRINSKF